MITIYENHKLKYELRECMIKLNIIDELDLSKKNENEKKNKKGKDFVYL